MCANSRVVILYVLTPESYGTQEKEVMDRARVKIEKAKEDVKEYKVFTEGIDKDGLIKKDETYTIKHKDGELIINGKKASNEM